MRSFSCVQLLWVLSILVALPGLAPADDPQPEKTKSDAGLDVNGDPLPKGAACRLGTARLKHAGPAYCVGYSANGKVLASGGADTLVRIWDAETGKMLQVCKGHADSVVHVAL